MRNLLIAITLVLLASTPYAYDHAGASVQQNWDSYRNRPTIDIGYRDPRHSNYTQQRQQHDSWQQTNQLRGINTQLEQINYNLSNPFGR